MTSEHAQWAKANPEASIITESCGVVLHATLMGRYTLRTEREHVTGRYLYYVDNVQVNVNKYLRVVRAHSPARG